MTTGPETDIDEQISHLWGEFTEVSEESLRPVGTVRSRLHYGRKKLKALLQG